MPLPSQLNNPLFPLPADYPELSEEGQRIARVNVCSSWWDVNQPKRVIADPAAFIIGFRAWKEWYRKGWKGNHQKYTLKSPPMHDKWVRDVAHNPHIIITAFRRSAKTFFFGEELPEFLISTCPHFPLQYTSSTQPLTEKQIRAVRHDLATNELLIRDFGKLQPTRKSGLVWTQEYIELTNGSSMKAVSSDQAQRGTSQASLRPKCGILDDPEIDSHLKNPRLREDWGEWYFQVYSPCFEPWALRIWANTLLDARAWATKAKNKEDERFYHWHSTQYDMLYMDEEGKLQSQWPDLISVEDALASAGRGKKGVMGYGREVFSKEFLNDPTSAAKGAFEYERDRHSYQWVGDTDDTKSLLLPDGRLESYKDLEARSICFIGTDLSLGTSSQSDFSSVIAARLDDRGILWVLEAWEDRCKPIDALYRALDMGKFWGASTLGIERIAFEQIAIDLLQDEIDARRMRGDYAPDLHVVKRGGGASKETRILGIGYRFRKDLIRIPIAGASPLAFGGGSASLEEQIQYFTETAKSLKYDDHLDSLVLIQEICNHIGGVLPGGAAPNPMDEFLKSAEKMGLPKTWLVDDPKNRMKLIQERAARKEIIVPDEMGCLLMGGGELWYDD